MNRKLLGGVLLVLGLVLIVVGLVLMFVIVPGQKQFPDDVDTTRYYYGTMPALLNPETLALNKDLEVQLVRHFEAEEVDGDIALVLEEQTLMMGDTLLAAPVIKRHVIDRKTMEFVEDYAGDWTTLEGFVPRGGLVLGWPIDTKKQNYDGWSDDYQQKVLLEFVEVVDHPRAGIETYYFKSGSGPMPIHPLAVTAMGFPVELSQEAIATMIGGMLAERDDLDIAPEMLEGLPLVLKAAQWPDPVPLEYLYEYEGEYWIEPTTGVLIDTHKIEIRTVTFSDELLASLAAALGALPAEMGIDPAMLNGMLPLPVFHLDYQTTDESVQDAKEDAEEVKDMLQLYGTTLPIAGIVIGLVLGIAGAFLFMQKKAAA